MNAKEISEIKKRFRPDKNNISRVRGCYINEKKEIVSRFDQSLNLMSVEESDEILSLIKKTLSGTINKNLLDIPFTNNQVLDSDEHRLLSALRNSSLADDNAVEKIINIIKDSLNFEGNYIIILASDTYDVPSYHSDGTKEEESNSIYSYIICSICPIKVSKPALEYYIPENKFKNITINGSIASPELGFLFPSFDGRTANIYDVLYYTKNTDDNHGELIEALFKSEPPMPASEQKENFQTILQDTVSESCNYDVVKSVHKKLNEIIDEHKASKDPDPLVISKNTIKDVLQNCGIEENKIDNFGEKFDSAFGDKAEVTPSNIIDTKQFQVKTPDVSIKLSNDAAELIETKVIDGQKYIMIRADGTVEVNGVEISIS